MKRNFYRAFTDVGNRSRSRQRLRAALGLWAALLWVGCETPRESPPPPLRSPTAAQLPSSTGATPAEAPGRTTSVQPDDSPPGIWQSLFDGQTLTGWSVTDFAGRGEVRVQEGRLILGNGVMTGVTWTGAIPQMSYEVKLDAMRVDGSDFFCGLTFPVGNDPCSLIVGGWGGGVVGLSSLDGEDAANNETTRYMSFEKGRWYAIRLRVAPGLIQAWIDEEKVVDANTAGRKISIRSEVEPSRPFGIATWSTTGALRNVRLRRL